MYCLGIDTSNYTTSVAVADSGMQLVYEARLMLEVPEGSRGLRQSEAHFQHSRNLPVLLEQCFSKLDPGRFGCICASTRPRSTDSSYMPVFTAGSNIAKILGAALKVPVYEVSHQQNHIIAGMWSSKYRFEDSFLAYHVSGGTTEILKVYADDTLKVSELGGSSDLKAGQFIDRVGVSMGLKFPCGKEMDRLCGIYPGKEIKVPVSVDGSFASFSGPETYIQRYIANEEMDDEKKAAVSRGVFQCIARSLELTALNAVKERKGTKLLFIGGVASNSIIKEYLINSRSLKESGIEPIFAEAVFSSDNAVGAALYGIKQFLLNSEE